MATSVPPGGLRKHVWWLLQVPGMQHNVPSLLAPKTQSSQCVSYLAIFRDAKMPGELERGECKQHKGYVKGGSVPLSTFPSEGVPPPLPAPLVLQRPCYHRAHGSRHLHAHDRRRRHDEAWYGEEREAWPEATVAGRGAEVGGHRRQMRRGPGHAPPCQTMPSQLVAMHHPDMSSHAIPCLQASHNKARQNPTRSDHCSSIVVSPQQPMPDNTCPSQISPRPAALRAQDGKVPPLPNAVCYRDEARCCCQGEKYM
eukprot:gene8181-biopygen13647